MKQNRFKKYIIIATILFVGIIFKSDIVYASSYSCQYTFEYSYYTGRDSEGKEIYATKTAVFQLKKVESRFAGTNEFNVVNNENFSVVKRVGVINHETNNSNAKNIVFNLDESGCPIVYVYQRRGLLAGAAGSSLNGSKFYMFDYTSSYHNDSNSVDYISVEKILNACSGKDANEEVLSGYACGNLISVEAESIIKGECSTDEKKELTKSKNSLIKKYLTNVYNSEMSLIKSNASTFKNSTSVTSDVCEAYPKLNSNIFNATALSEEIKNLIDNATCTLDENSVADFSNIQSKADSYSKALGEEWELNYRKCVNKISDLTDEKKEELKDDAAEEVDDYVQDVSDAYASAQSELVSWTSKISSIDLGDDVEIDCEGLLGDDLIDFLSKILNYIQIAAPILLIVLGSVDFGQAVLSDDKDALKKAGSKFIKRAIICVAIFFVPIILRYLLEFLDGMSTDPLCGVNKG